MPMDNKILRPKDSGLPPDIDGGTPSQSGPARIDGGIPATTGPLSLNGGPP
jgi:hypothetical protein